MAMPLKSADETAQRLWDEDVKPWQTYWAPIFSRFADDLVTSARIADGQVVLDVGTGTGTAAIKAAKSLVRHGFVFAIDRSLPILSVAKSYCSKNGPLNVRFLVMDARKMQFPDGLFDHVISNCGTSFRAFDEMAVELSRVLRRGGSLAYNNWHLKDVPAHRLVGEVLQKHRTKKPSSKLRAQRLAMATLERHGNWDMDLEAQVRDLRRAGFNVTRTWRKSYRISLGDVDDFLKMRFSMAMLRQELLELRQRQRTELYKDLRQELREFMRKDSFTFEWKINFVQAVKR